MSISSHEPARILSVSRVGHCWVHVLCRSCIIIYVCRRCRMIVPHWANFIQLSQMLRGCCSGRCRRSRALLVLWLLLQRRCDRELHFRTASSPGTSSRTLFVMNTTGSVQLRRLDILRTIWVIYKKYILLISRKLRISSLWRLQ